MSQTHHGACCSWKSTPPRWGSFVKALAMTLHSCKPLPLEQRSRKPAFWRGQHLAKGAYDYTPQSAKQNTRPVRDQECLCHSIRQPCLGIIAHTFSHERGGCCNPAGKSRLGRLTRFDHTCRAATAANEYRQAVTVRGLRWLALQPLPPSQDVHAKCLCYV